MRSLAAVAVIFASVLVGGGFTSAAPSAGGVRVLGPFHLTYQQFTTEGATVPLFRTKPGDVVIKSFGDVETAVPFNDSGSIDFAVGENPDYNTCSGFWAFLGNSLSPDWGFPDSDSPNNANSICHDTGTAVLHGGTVKISAVSVAGDGTTGQMDLFFVIATPTAA